MHVPGLVKYPPITALSRVYCH